MNAGDENQVRNFFTEREFDHVVISAAVFNMGGVRDCDVEIAKARLDDKFWLHSRVAHYARITSSGSLLFVGGNRSRKFTPRTGCQATLEAMAKQLVLELAPVRVNIVSPGMVATPIPDTVFGGANAKQEVYDQVAASLPIERIGQAKEVGALIVHILNNEYVNGSVIDIDGGDLLV